VEERRGLGVLLRRHRGALFKNRCGRRYAASHVTICVTSAASGNSAPARVDDIWLPSRSDVHRPHVAEGESNSDGTTAAPRLEGAVTSAIHQPPSSTRRRIADDAVIVLIRSSAARRDRSGCRIGALIRHHRHSRIGEQLHIPFRALESAPDKKYEGRSARDRDNIPSGILHLQLRTGWTSVCPARQRNWFMGMSPRAPIARSAITVFANNATTRRPRARRRLRDTRRLLDVLQFCRLESTAYRLAVHARAGCAAYVIVAGNPARLTV